MKGYKNALCISGTHGKTTTTSMATHIFMAAQKDPTVMIGGTLQLLHSGYRVGKGDTIIAESCEYCNSFLSFFPTVAVILNVEADHLDFFKDIDDIRHSFRAFARLLPTDGMLIINADTPKYDYVTEGLGCKVVTYALENQAVADYTAANITYDEFDHPSFDCICRGELRGRYTLMVPGLHNVSNALAAIALADELQLPENAIHEGFATFRGTDRRFQYKGTYHGAKVIDDYAHHPTEIRATMEAAENCAHRTLWCVFQPHTYTRTKALLDDFAAALSLADHVVLADIYAARETDTLGISSKDIQERIVKLGTACEYFPSFAEIENYLNENLAEGDMLITMGAGDVVKIGEELLASEK